VYVKYKTDAGQHKFLKSLMWSIMWTFASTTSVTSVATAKNINGRAAAKNDDSHHR